VIRSLCRPRRSVCGAAALFAGFLSMAIAPGGAHAQWGTCYDDPAVFLNNGATVFLGATFQGSSSSVSAVNYVLHVPVGVSVTRVAYFGPNKSVETLIWTADNQANTYDSATQVVAPNTTYATTAVMAIVGDGYSLNYASGQTNQNLLTEVLTQ